MGQGEKLLRGVQQRKDNTSPRNGTNGLLVQRKQVHIDHAILGSSDLDQETGLSARFKAWLIAKVLHGVFRTGKLPGFMQK